MSGWKGWRPTGAITAIIAPWEDNGDAHLKNLLIHHQVLLPITAGKLDLGPWQQVLLRRVRWPAEEAADHQDPGGIVVVPRGPWSSRPWPKRQRSPSGLLRRVLS